MHISGLKLDVDKGELILTDADGRAARYERTLLAVQPTVMHAIVDERGGPLFRNALIDADDFPRELFIKHRSPGHQAQPPVPLAIEWRDVFRYVLKT
jgi:hypothetical protein